MGVTFKKVIKITLALVVFVTVAIQFVRPTRTNPASDPAAALAPRVQVPADVSTILDRSCRDCHSNDTRWPWYSNVAPVSWWMIDHVNHGRRHFNYSEWARYNNGQQQNLLKQSCTLVRRGDMPLPSYLRMHDARPTAMDIQALCAFADALQSPVVSH